MAEKTITLNSISPRLINELALGLYPPSEVFRRFGYSEADAARLIDSGAFRKALKDAKEKWASTESAEERVRLKALIALEEMMPHLFAMGVDETVNPTARNETFKTFAKIAGMEKPAQDATAGSGPGFAINIHLGDTKREIVIENPVREIGSDE